MVSEGDLLHRIEAGTEQHRSWWLLEFAAEEKIAAEYAKAHARNVADVMTHNVITTDPETPLHEIAALLEKNSIKRVPVVKDGQLVGIVSRGNLVQAVASTRRGLDIPLSDTAIRDNLLTHLKAQSWAQTRLLNVTVVDGIVDLWGITKSEAQKKAIRAAAESTPSVRFVKDNLVVRPALVPLSTKRE
jgi:CBS-domain-containing membrane protein